ncbi:MAG: hypothetical protein C0617_12045 [Desulfuromonas sp.]|uniref:BadF/BadG/BcrA/BcrD ATPase family protein n=1 Tax=Desulfuromonas sp. TaxID=892 RepID=UPI000CBB3F20|nr:BadF/BadG/BcrA/BcrD ATPase family protein [Desulfuromonas sp.]PLX83257.1 MAG: hypothetical protein C0617_12045 [Desulfuromonas sp.]
MEGADKPEAVIGLDAGSTGVKVAVIDAVTRERLEVLPYRRHHNRYAEVARELLRYLLERYRVRTVAVTGSTGQALHRAWHSTVRVPEVEAHAAGARALNPEVGAVLDGGGAEIKFFRIDAERRTTDFAMNPECAAGAGSFLDVQAKRLLLETDDPSDPSRHFPTLGLEAIRSGRTVPISGRCSVLAKSDMIHQQQKAVPMEAIVGGLHEAMAGNIQATVIQSRLKDFTGTLSFQGGLALNPTMRQSLASQLDLPAERIFCHDLAYAAGAIGAALLAEADPFDPADLDHRPGGESRPPVWPRLADDYAATEGPGTPRLAPLPPDGPRVRAYLCIDIGSVSTKVALIAEESEEVLAKDYGPTAGRPIEALKRCLGALTEALAARLGASGSLAERAAAVEERVEIVGVGSTGSGRFVAGHFLQADSVRNEITAQAVGAVRLFRGTGESVGTIFEIGGQDSKYIRLDSRGGVRDYVMNKVCAAGCGSFLEEQCEKLAIDLQGEFAAQALAAPHPADLGDRCTVFIDSVMDNLGGAGERRENLVAGLAYSVANNYLNRVVEGRPLEGNIFFQGGTAFNRAVVLAFQKILGRPVRVTPHHEVTGAVGAACLAKDELTRLRTADPACRTPFGGLLDAVAKPYRFAERTCTACPNSCELQVVEVTESVPGTGGEPVQRLRQIFYGDRCDELNLGRDRAPKGDTLLELRNRLLFDRPLAPRKPNGLRVGIPRAMSSWGEYFPLWATLFTELGFEVVLSGPTTKATVGRGAATALSDYCSPVRAAHGAVHELLESGTRPDILFIPHLVSYPRRNPEAIPYACLWTQSLPIAAGQAFDLESLGVRLLAPVCDFRRPDGGLEALAGELTASLGLPRSRVLKALKNGLEEVTMNRVRSVELGRKALAEASPERPAFLVIGRPYNSCDPGLCLDLFAKLERLGPRAVPMDLLPLEELPLAPGTADMYWKNGERILSAFRYAAEHPGLIPVWITNFGCGPDSFIRKEVRYLMGERPYLELELDEHSADAGLVTRIEAFFDAWRNHRQTIPSPRACPPPAAPRVEVSGRQLRRGKVLAFCHMGDTVFALAAIFRARGLDAVVLPRTTARSLALGKRHSSGQECVPYQATLGDKLLFLTEQQKRCQLRPGEEFVLEGERRPEDVVFFDPFATGPCRFGQYNAGYRKVFAELGLPAGMLCSGVKNHYADIFRDRRDAVLGILLAYEGICAIDTLQKALRTVRPLAREPETANALYREAMDELLSLLERPGGGWGFLRAQQKAVETLMDRCARRFAALERDPVREREIANVGMFGEIYVRSEPFINEFLIERLEEHGIRTYLAPINEWLRYLNHDALWRWRTGGGQQRGLGRLLDPRHLADRVRHRWLPRRLARLESPFQALPGWLPDPPVSATVEAARPKVTEHIKGELILSWGLAREVQHSPALHGMVHIGPFGCMPGKVASTLLHDPEITKPVLDANFDGSFTASRSLRIETFASQVKAYARRTRTP